MSFNIFRKTISSYHLLLSFASSYFPVSLCHLLRKKSYKICFPLFEMFSTPFSYAKSRKFISFFKLCMTETNYTPLQPREILSHRSLELVKCPFKSAIFVATNFSLRKDWSTHSISIVCMCCSFPRSIYNIK